MWPPCLGQAAVAACDRPSPLGLHEKTSTGTSPEGRLLGHKAHPFSIFEQTPHCLLWRLSRSSLPPTVHEGSLSSTSRPTQDTGGRDSVPLTFPAARFLTAKMWKQLKCPSTDERIKKLSVGSTVLQCSLD